MSPNSFEKFTFVTEQIVATYCQLALDITQAILPTLISSILFLLDLICYLRLLISVISNVGGLRRALVNIYDIYLFLLDSGKIASFPAVEIFSLVYYSEPLTPCCLKKYTADRKNEI